LSAGQQGDATEAARTTGIVVGVKFLIEEVKGMVDARVQGRKMEDKHFIDWLAQAQQPVKGKGNYLRLSPNGG
jgi:hypothetical protein